MGNIWDRIYSGVRRMAFNCEVKYPERIRELRQDNDLTQKEIADMLKVAQTTYSQYELYKRPMPIECLMALCRFYKVSSDYILGFTDKKEKIQ